MKKRYILAAICIGFTTSGQLSQDSLEINTLKPHVYSDGGIWELQAKDSSIYKTLVFADGIWIGGYDGATLHLSAQTYRQSGLDFVPGPVSNDPNATQKYDKVYKVNLQTLSDFKNGITLGIPPEIAQWPAHGDTNMGEAYYLAPFVDVNNDGHYKPSDGDYPAIKGDEAIFTIYNDINGRSQGLGLGVEVHSMIYGYNTGGIEDSILFREYKLINRSGTTYNDSYLGLWADFDLGNARDDISGTLISSNSVYSYNADNDDEGPSGFGQNLASVGLRMLQGPPATLFDGVDNDKDGCIDGVRDANGICQNESPSGPREQILLSGSMYYNNNPTVQGNPDTPLDYYQYMQSRWKNGNNLIIETPSGFASTQNGDGYVSNNTGNPTTYFYPGNSYDTTGAFQPISSVNWWEATSNSHDKRTLANAGPFTFDAGQEMEIVTAYVWSRKPGMANSLNDLLQKLAYLDTNYTSQPKRTVGIRSHQVKSGYTLSYKANSGEWEIHNPSAINLTFGIYNVAGLKIKDFAVTPTSVETVPLQSIANGVYLLINTDSGKSHKIISR